MKKILVLLALGAVLVCTVSLTSIGKTEVGHASVPAAVDQKPMTAFAMEDGDSF